MTQYEQQIESGKEIVWGIIFDLAAEFGKPQFCDPTFMVTDQDFDRDLVSVLYGSRILAKIERDDLADCLADRGVRRTLEKHLRRAIEANGN